MDSDSLQTSKVEDIEENKKSKNDFDLENSFGLLTDMHGDQDLMKRYLEIKERKFKETLIRRKIEDLRNEISMFHRSSMFHNRAVPPAAASIRDSEFDTNAGNTSWRSISLLKCSKQAKEERERLLEEKETMRIQDKRVSLYRRLNRTLLHLLKQGNSASALGNSTATGNNCGMETLLIKLNDISLQVFPDADQDITDTDCEMR